MPSPTPNPIDSAETRQALLRYARDVAKWILSGSRGAGPSKPSVKGGFGGAFVTFHRGPELRGCVGTFAPTKDLAATLEQVTRSSLGDPRFTDNPIHLEELPKLTIEISILSDLERTNDPLGLILGTHGIMVRRGDSAGCFLPKVGSERVWTAEEFLSQCCTLKAHLPADAWRKPETAVYLFTAEAFSDAEDV